MAVKENAFHVRKKSRPYKKGRSVMRRIILAILLAAGVMYVILHCNLWRTNSYWLPPTDFERKVQVLPCTPIPSNLTLVTFTALYPFLCPHNFQQVSELHGSFSFDLPYGIRRAERFFQLALSKSNNCGLFAEDDSSPSCKKCVVVGNGGVLRNKSLGETIDSFDVVIRMNNGPVVGYEEDVGRRTTYRLFYPESVFSDPIHYDPNTTAVLVVFKPYDLKWLWDLLSGQRFIRPRHPTTGLIAITFALQICSEVHLAGFKYNLNDRNSSLHYYGNDTMSQMMKNAYHDIAVEQRFLKELIDLKILINLT
ncbi:type 2 lactosamine alpha-2,3-sialyltransferase isoform X5 [Anolis carolinensis]|uniref:type 2 lactosamine alpha-2,3-sialyltransferase isoform X5 n=1 Tax=Anolis carolinensis TaxID=28377 RepID=UPI002F2B718D